ncbi:MAG: SDR family oxidoreductase [Maricaulaceae bacterium]
MARLRNKVAIITGGSKGLGEANARLFIKEGATVIITDIDEKNGHKVAKEIGTRAEFYKQDVRDEDGWKSLIAQVVKDHGKLDILVNNAGVVEAGTIENQKTEDYRFVMAVSADGTFFGSKYAIAAMKETGGGSIINMASIASIQGAPNVLAYSAAKGAVEAMTRTIAAHCAVNKYGIRCNSVHPSAIMTPMVQGIREKISKANIPNAKESKVVEGNKIGDPIDIANTVLFLASDESRFINGAQIRVDNAISIVSGTVPE